MRAEEGGWTGVQQKETICWMREGKLCLELLLLHKPRDNAVWSHRVVGKREK